LIDTQLLSRAHLLRTLTAPSATTLLSIERLLLLSRAHIVDAVAYCVRAFESSALRPLLRDRLVHACTTRAGAQPIGVALVGMLLSSDARLAMLEHLLVADALQQDELLLRFVGCVGAQLRGVERDAAAHAGVALLERMLVQREASVLPFAPLPATVTIVQRNRDVFGVLRELLGAERVADACFLAATRASGNQRWSVLLPVLRDIAALSADACALVVAALDRAVDLAADNVDRALLQRCIVVARALERSAEHATEFGTYADWLSGAAQRGAQRVRFVCNCLCDMAPHDAAVYLLVHERVVDASAHDLLPAFRDAAGASVAASVSDVVHDLFAVGLSSSAALERIASWRATRADWFERVFVPHAVACTTWRSPRGTRRMDDLVLAMCSNGLLDRATVLSLLCDGDDRATAVRDICLAKEARIAAVVDDTSALALLACICAVPVLVLPPDRAVEALVRLAPRVACAAVSRALESVLCAPSAPRAALWCSDYALQACAVLAHAQGGLGGVVARLANAQIVTTDDALWFVRRCAAVWDAALATRGARASVPGRVALLLSWLGARLQATAQHNAVAAQLLPHFSSSRMCVAVRLAGRLRRPLPLRCVVEFELTLADDAALAVHERAVWLRLGVEHALVREFGGDRALLCQTLLDALVRHAGASRAATAYALFIGALQQHCGAVRAAWPIAVLTACHAGGAALVHRCVDALLLLPPSSLLGASPSARDLRGLARWLCRAQRDFDVVLLRRDFCVHVASALLAHESAAPAEVAALLRWPPLLAALAVDWSRVSSAMLIEPRARDVFATVDSVAALLSGAALASRALALPVLRASPVAVGAALGLNAFEPSAALLDAVLALLDQAPSPAVFAFCYAVAAAFASTPARHELDVARRTVRSALLHFAGTLAANNGAAAHLASRFAVAFRAAKLFDAAAWAAVSTSATANERWKVIAERVEKRQE
jgi:hypothetical protein